MPRLSSMGAVQLDHARRPRREWEIPMGQRKAQERVEARRRADARRRAEEAAREAAMVDAIEPLADPAAVFALQRVLARVATSERLDDLRAAEEREARDLRSGGTAAAREAKAKSRWVATGAASAAPTAPAPRSKSGTRAKPRPAWDDSVSDLRTYRLSDTELREKRLRLRSHNHARARELWEEQQRRAQERVARDRSAAAAAAADGVRAERSGGDERGTWSTDSHDSHEETSDAENDAPFASRGATSESGMNRKRHGGRSDDGGGDYDDNDGDDEKEATEQVARIHIVEAPSSIFTRARDTTPRKCTVAPVRTVAPADWLARSSGWRRTTLASADDDKDDDAVRGTMNRGNDHGDDDDDVRNTDDILGSIARAHADVCEMQRATGRMVLPPLPADLQRLSRGMLMRLLLDLNQHRRTLREHRRLEASFASRRGNEAAAEQEEEEEAEVDEQQQQVPPPPPPRDSRSFEPSVGIEHASSAVIIGRTFLPTSAPLTMFDPSTGGRLPPLTDEDRRAHAARVQQAREEYEREIARRAASEAAAAEQQAVERRREHTAASIVNDEEEDDDDDEDLRPRAQVPRPASREPSLTQAPLAAGASSASFGSVARRPAVPPLPLRSLPTAAASTSEAPVISVPLTQRASAHAAVRPLAQLFNLKPAALRSR